jgi:hypothetical protein
MFSEIDEESDGEVDEEEEEEEEEKKKDLDQGFRNNKKAINKFSKCFLFRLCAYYHEYIKPRGDKMVVLLKNYENKKKKKLSPEKYSKFFFHKKIAKQFECPIYDQRITRKNDLQIEIEIFVSYILYKNITHGEMDKKRKEKNIDYFGNDKILFLWNFLFFCYKNAGVLEKVGIITWNWYKEIKKLFLGVMGTYEKTNFSKWDAWKKHHEIIGPLILAVV